MKFGNVELIAGENNGRYPFANTLLIEDSIRVLIDPAAGCRKMTEVRERGRIDVIINTHYHEDHVRYNYLFPEAQIYFHEADSPGFESIDGMLKMWLGCRLTPERRRDFICTFRDEFHFLGWKADRHLKGGDALEFGSTKVEVVHLPGHTPGHIGFFFPDIELLYCSDIDLTPFGPWYGDSSSNIDDIIDSTRRIGSAKAKWYVPSHEGPVYEDVSELVEKYIKVVLDREERVYGNIGEPATLDELAQRWIIYRKPHQPESMYLPSEAAMIEKHLDRLVRMGKAFRDGEKFGAI